MSEYVVLKVDTCDVCKGSGQVRLPHCYRCNWAIHCPVVITKVLNKGENERVPCGHTLAEIVSIEPCPNCVGKGEFVTRVSLLEALVQCGGSQEPGPDMMGRDA